MKNNTFILPAVAAAGLAAFAVPYFLASAASFQDSAAPADSVSQRMLYASAEIPASSGMGTGIEASGALASR